MIRVDRADKFAPCGSDHVAGGLIVGIDVIVEASELGQRRPAPATVSWIVRQGADV
jgi:hypothetical protein